MRPRAILDDIATAGTLLTRMPGFARLLKHRDVDLTRSVWAYPLIGALVGLIGGAVYAVALAFGLGAMIAAGLAIAVQVLATGGFHEDGLADVADGLGGGQSREQKLEIMRDSRLGSYGALALILVTGLRWAALATTAIAGAPVIVLVCAGVLARTAIAGLLAVLPPARRGGMGAVASSPPGWVIRTAFVLGGLTALTLLPLLTAMAAIVATITAAAVTALIGYRHIGGYTGDLLGTAAQAAEVAVLLALVTIMGL